MPVSSALRREFCRRLFRTDLVDEAARSALLDSISDAAVAASNDGRAVQATAANGASVAFQFVNGWDPQATVELVDEARGWITAANLADALALIEGPVREYRQDFTALQR